MKDRYLNCLLAILLLLPGASQSWATDDPTYRVDVIVFSHVSGELDQRFSPDAATFSHYPDLNGNARAVNWTRGAEMDRALNPRRERQSALATIDQIQALENNSGTAGPTLVDGPRFPAQWVGLETLSSEMARAWERLVESNRHAPITRRSWHQRVSPANTAPRFRLRGGATLGLDWMEMEAISEPFLPAHGPTPFRLPETTHQLDGMIRLRQRQFMHIDLELVWQNQVLASPAPLRQEWYQTPGYETHVLKQSRAIRADRIEYFDSSGLGVLVLVEPFDQGMNSSVQVNGRP